MIYPIVFVSIGFNHFPLFSIITPKTRQKHAKNIAGLEKGCIFAAQSNFKHYGNNNIITLRKGGQDNWEI